MSTEASGEVETGVLLLDCCGCECACACLNRQIHPTENHTSEAFLQRHVNKLYLCHSVLLKPCAATLGI